MPDSIDPAADQECIWDPGFHGSDIRHDLEQDHKTYHPKAATGGYTASGSGRWIFLSKRSFHHQHVRIRHAAVFDLDTREKPAAQKYIVGPCDDPAGAGGTEPDLPGCPLPYRRAGGLVPGIRSIDGSHRSGAANNSQTREKIFIKIFAENFAEKQ